MLLWLYLVQEYTKDELKKAPDNFLTKRKLGDGGLGLFTGATWVAYIY